MTIVPARESMDILESDLHEIIFAESLQDIQPLKQQLSRMNTLFQLSRRLEDASLTSRTQLIRLASDCIALEFLITHLLVVDHTGNVQFQRGFDELPATLTQEDIRQARQNYHLCHAMPLRDKSARNNYAYAAEPAIGKLGAEDRRFLQTILSLTSAHLSALDLRESQWKKVRMEKDLELARDIQRRILPKRLPEPPGWSCTAANLPFESVGGDLYDLWLTESSHHGPEYGVDKGQPEAVELHIAVGDVSGKGLPASLMMTQLSTFLRSTADRKVSDWSELAHRLNRRMNEVREGNRFATLFAGSLNPANGVLRYINAGHNPPILVSHCGGQVQELAPTGTMVGLFPGASFTEGQAQLQPGDVLLLFTDGLVDAENTQGEELGTDALIQITRHTIQRDSDDIFEAILTAAFKHMEGSGFRDDVTLVVIKRHPSNQTKDM